MPQKQTVLEAALDQDIDAPYSCQGGICSSCIARVTEGKATMRQNNILTDGVDYISSGALTHSVYNKDLSLKAVD